MSHPWGSVNRSRGARIQYYRVTDSGTRYDWSWDQNVRYLSTNRFNHSSNPPDSSGFRGPSSYFVSRESFDTKYGAMSWREPWQDYTTFLEGPVTGWMEDHVGTAGPCLEGLSMQADANLEAQAITECLNKLADAKTSVLQNLATARQTANLLGDTVKNLADALIAVKRFNGRRSANALLDASGNLFLIYKFGWEPLVKDASGALDLLMKKNLAPTVGVTRNVKRSVDRSSSERGYRWTSGYTVNSKCKLWAQVDSTWSRGVAQAGAGVGSIPYVIWDLVPWSFAVDWVLPIGGVLSALTATAGLSFRTGYVSNYVRAHADISVIPGPFQNITSDFGGRFEGEWYQRRLLSGFPLPEPYVKSPFTVTHALESLSLLRQLRHKL